MWYAHDDSETLEDRLTLRLSDGVHSLSATAAIGVLPVDDHPPRLLKYAHANNGGRVVIGRGLFGHGFRFLMPIGGGGGGQRGGGGAVFIKGQHPHPRPTKIAGKVPSGSHHSSAVWRLGSRDLLTPSLPISRCGPLGGVLPTTSRKNTAVAAFFFLQEMRL